MEHENDYENGDVSKAQDVFLFSKKVNAITEFIYS